MSDLPKVEVSLWASDAVVLFEFLWNVDYDKIPVQHKAERQALVDLLSRLEESMDPPTPAEVRVAREEVARDMP
jgi:hypothetical protein